MSDPYFLTRQTANLMEDFVREFNTGSGLFVLYGDDGIGKSRLLREMCDNRLADARVRLLDIRGGLEDGAARRDCSEEIEKLFADAGAGDIIVIDHFETAMQKTRHQLFLSWTTEGIDKRLNLVVATGNEGFDELSLLAQQYQTEVQSFRLKPLGADEVRAFLGFYLFPDNPAGDLEIPATLRRQLAAAGGNLAKIVAIAEHDGAGLRAKPLAAERSSAPSTRIAVLALLLVAIGAAVGWYLINRPAPSLTATPSSGSETLAAAAPAAPPAAATGGDGSDEAEAEPAQDTGLREDAAAPITEMMATGAMPAATGTEEGAAEALSSEQADGTAGSGGGEAEAGDTGNSGPQGVMDEAANANESGNAGEPGDSSEPGNTGDSVETSNASDTMEAAAGMQAQTADDGVRVAATDSPMQQASANGEAADSVAAPSAPQRLSLDARFARDLDASRGWLAQQDDSVGTVQILLLKFDTFDLQNYYRFVDDLARRGVDIDGLHIFKVLTGNAVVYSVFYGEYPSRQRAYAAIAGLPAALAEMAPITRSAGGIREEIRRLQVKN